MKVKLIEQTKDILKFSIDFEIDNPTRSDYVEAENRVRGIINRKKLGHWSWGGFFNGTRFDEIIAYNRNY